MIPVLRWCSAAARGRGRAAGGSAAWAGPFPGALWCSRSLPKLQMGSCTASQTASCHLTARAPPPAPTVKPSLASQTAFLAPAFSPAPKQVVSFPISVWSGLFLVLSALDHLVVALPGINKVRGPALYILESSAKCSHAQPCLVTLTTLSHAQPHSVAAQKSCWGPPALLCQPTCWLHRPHLILPPAPYPSTHLHIDTSVETPNRALQVYNRYLCVNQNPFRWAEYSSEAVSIVLALGLKTVALPQAALHLHVSACCCSVLQHKRERTWCSCPGPKPVHLGWVGKHPCILS